MCKNASASWLDFGAINAPGDQDIVSALGGSRPQYAATGKVPSFMLRRIRYALPKGGKKEKICGAKDILNTARAAPLLSRTARTVMASCGSKMCQVWNCPVGEELAKGSITFVMADSVFDVAVLQIKENETSYATKYGYLRLQDGEAKESETFLLVQPPQGDPKVFAGALKDGMYVTDTEQGSSGSPVASRKNGDFANIDGFV
ncbi:hypothetical protein PybrP1_003341 [[Pythium] brassicae (nom. inval.)]|nr:hypothetical protein PybrP1_003341 [[Pythium] brassicae (nom. inval.)]